MDSQKAFILSEPFQGDFTLNWIIFPVENNVILGRKNILDSMYAVLKKKIIQPLIWNYWKTQETYSDLIKYEKINFFYCIRKIIEISIAALFVAVLR